MVKMWLRSGDDSTLQVYVSSPPYRTVAKCIYYPKQDTTIHTIEGKQLWAVTIAGKQTHTNQGSNTSFPHEAGEHGVSSAATATPSQARYTKLA